MNKSDLIRSLATLAALFGVAILISLIRSEPRVFPAFDRRVLPIIVALLATSLPVSLWQARGHLAKTLQVVLAYVATVAVLVSEFFFARSAFDPSTALIAIATIGASYGVLFVSIIRLARERFWFAVSALLLFSGIGMADWYRANVAHGSIHWIMKWKA